RLDEVVGVAPVAPVGVGDLGDRPPAKGGELPDELGILVDPDPELPLGEGIVAVVDEGEDRDLAERSAAPRDEIAGDEFPQRPLVAEERRGEAGRDHARQDPAPRLAQRIPGHGRVSAERVETGVRHTTAIPAYLAGLSAV